MASQAEPAAWWYQLLPLLDTDDSSCQKDQDLMALLFDGWHGSSAVVYDKDDSMPRDDPRDVDAWPATR